MTPEALRRLRSAYENELAMAAAALARGDGAGAWRALERAHILGQPSTAAHVRAHWAMLKYAWRRADAREVAGQISRLIGAALFTRIWVPPGNTGGANVSAFRAMPIPDDLRRLLEDR